MMLFIDPVSGKVIDWNESITPQMPSPIVSPPFWLLFNCARNRSFELRGIAASLHFVPRVGAPTCFQYPQSPTYAFYATSVFFSIPFVLVVIAGVCLLLWTLNWTLAMCKRLCKRRRGKFQAPPSLSRAAQLASMQNSPSLNSATQSVTCVKCIKRRTRPRLRDLRQKQNMEALRGELEELNSELNKIVEPPPAFCTFGACVVIAILVCGLVLTCVGTFHLLNNLEGVPPLQPQTRMKLVSSTAGAASHDVTSLSHDFDALVAACGSPGTWVKDALAGEARQLTSVAQLSAPARFPLLDLVTVGLRPQNDVFILPAVVAFLLVSALLVVFGKFASLYRNQCISQRV